MFDGFWAGLFGGLFGPAIAQLLRRYKYWAIFLFVMSGVHLGIFAVGAFSRGLEFAIRATLEQTFTPSGILAPIAVALLAVFVAFIGSLNASKDEGKSR
jgi:uncharacterized membrane protein